MRKTYLLGVLLLLLVASVFAESITGMGIMDNLKKLFTAESFDILSSGALNCSVASSCSGNQTAVLKLFALNNSHAALPNQSWGNYSVCCEDATGTFNVSTSSNGTAFLKLYQANNSHVGIPVNSSYNLSAFISADNNMSITCDYVSTYGNCTANITNGTNLTNAACLVTIPNINNGTNLHVADCNSTPYEVSVCCAFGAEEYEIIIYIDGNETTAFPIAGIPYNLTILTKKQGVLTPLNLTVREVNSLFHLAIIQTSPDPISNTASGIVATDSNGRVEFAVVPTAGEPAADPYVGNYSLDVNIVGAGGNVLATEQMTVTNRTLAPQGVSKSIPNQLSVKSSNDNVLRIFERAQSGFNQDFGDTFNFTIFNNGSGSGNLSLKAGRIAVIEFTVRDAVTSNPLANARVEIVEQNSIMPWTLVQLGTYSAGNTALGNGTTNSTGQLTVLAIPTGGVPGTAGVVGPYGFTINAYDSGGSLIYSQAFVIGSLADPAAPTTTIPAKGAKQFLNDNLLRLFERVQTST
ncbi:Uncharacterised protein [uncultured archaeon]|nr:Uncharacterised protein [uncultured archaeon]